MKLLVLLGLTGVGKSTVVSALRDSGVAFTLLPNRRVLTDERLIPEQQRADGQPVLLVTDRLERFALTRRYRERRPGGMAQVLQDYLRDTPPPENELLVFDNVRGLEETRAAAELFAQARFILLDAPPRVRLLRLVGRSDTFDNVAPLAPGRGLSEQLRALDGLETFFSPAELLRLSASGVPDEALVKAARIILSEAENYDMGAAARYLQGVSDAAHFLYLDTGALSVPEVRARIQGWL